MLTIWLKPLIGMIAQSIWRSSHFLLHQLTSHTSFFIANLGSEHDKYLDDSQENELPASISRACTPSPLSPPPPPPLLLWFFYLVQFLPLIRALLSQALTLYIEA